MSGSKAILAEAAGQATIHGSPRRPGIDNAYGLRALVSTGEEKRTCIGWFTEPFKRRRGFCRHRAPRPESTLNATALDDTMAWQGKCQLDGRTDAISRSRGLRNPRQDASRCSSGHQALSFRLASPGHAGATRTSIHHQEIEGRHGHGGTSQGPPSTPRAGDLPVFERALDNGLRA